MSVKERCSSKQSTGPSYRKTSKEKYTCRNVHYFNFRSVFGGKLYMRTTLKTSSAGEQCACETLRGLRLFSIPPDKMPLIYQLVIPQLFKSFLTWSIHLFYPLGISFRIFLVALLGSIYHIAKPLTCTSLYISDNFI